MSIPCTSIEIGDLRLPKPGARGDVVIVTHSFNTPRRTMHAILEDFGFQRAHQLSFEYGAFQAVATAHQDGGGPVVIVMLNRESEAVYVVRARDYTGEPDALTLRHLNNREANPRFETRTIVGLRQEIRDRGPLVAYVKRARTAVNPYNGETRTDAVGETADLIHWLKPHLDEDWGY